MSVQEAKLRLEKAKSQLERVQVASYEPKDPEQGVTWAFYAYENAVVAAALYLGIDWKPTHPSKVAVARLLHDRGILSRNVSELLERLNELRKDVQYDVPGPDLEAVDLEDLATELEGFIQEIEGLWETNRSE